MPDVLSPLTHLVAAALAATHTLVTRLGLDPGGGAAWLLAVVGLVIAVRVVLLPLTAHSVRLARATGSARPQLTELRRRHRGRTDLQSRRELAAEQRRIHAEHGVSRAGCLPVLLQLPILFALYHVLAGVARGEPVGAMDAVLVAAAGSASLLGVSLADRLDLSAAPEQVAVVAGLAVTAALLSYATQRWFVLPNLVLEGMPQALADAQRMTPVLSAAGLLVAAGAVPVGLLLYWVASNTWTLGQQAVVTRWFPTPGSPAHTARRARREGQRGGYRRRRM